MKRTFLAAIALVCLFLSSCGGGSPRAGPRYDRSSHLSGVDCPGAPGDTRPANGRHFRKIIVPVGRDSSSAGRGVQHSHRAVLLGADRAGQAAYQIDNLPAGTYNVFAYALPDGKMVGAYDQFYVCGLHQGCTDLSLIDVEVKAGAVTPNIDPGDWYGDPAQWPPMPNDPSIPNLGVGGEDGGAAGTGSIAGQLSYPSSFIPSMVVTAYEVGGQNYRYVITNQNSTAYQIDDLAPGNYFVVAYPADNPSYPGGYSAAVPCGLLASCTDHSLIPVEVKSGEVTQGINPGDFYAPAGTFPPSPLP